MKMMRFKIFALIGLMFVLADGGTFLMYAHLSKNLDDQHGIGQRDLHAFSKFLSLQ